MNVWARDDNGELFAPPPFPVAGDFSRLDAHFATTDVHIFVEEKEVVRCAYSDCKQEILTETELCRHPLAGVVRTEVVVEGSCEFVALCVYVYVCVCVCVCVCVGGWVRISVYLYASGNNNNIVILV